MNGTKNRKLLAMALCLLLCVTAVSALADVALEAPSVDVNETTEPSETATSNLAATEAPSRTVDPEPDTAASSAPADETTGELVAESEITETPAITEALAEETPVEPSETPVLPTNEELADPEEQEEETELPDEEEEYPLAEQADAVRHISISIQCGRSLQYGDTVTLCGVLEGYDGLSVSCQWQYKTSDSWTNISGATGPDYSFALTEANAFNDYRLSVTVSEP